MPTRQKFTLYPTAPQRDLIDALLSRGAIQWNKAVFIRRTLKAALDSGNLPLVVDTILSRGGKGKNDHHPARLKAVSGICSRFNLPFDQASRLHDIKLLTGELFDSFGPCYLDRDTLLDDLQELSTLDKDKVTSQLLTAINFYSGWTAIRFMSGSYMAPKGTALSSFRSVLTGIVPGLSRWIKALDKGEPRTKDHLESFSYCPGQSSRNIIKERRRGGRGNLVSIAPLPARSRNIIFSGRLLIPPAERITEITVKKYNDARYSLIVYTAVKDRNAARTGMPILKDIDCWGEAAAV